MKRVLLLTFTAAASTATLAQDSLVFYGIADAGVTYTSGVRGDSIKQLVSGIMDGSRVGVRGNEDLGGGYRVLLTLENRFEIDSGSLSNRPPSGSQLPDRVSYASYLGLPNAFQPVVTAVANSIGSTVGVNLNGAFFDRQAYVGLVTPVGAVLAGRQYTPAYEVVATFDTLGTQSALSVGQVASLPASVDIRISNALVYRIQLGGFSAAAMAAAGEGSSVTGHLLGINGIYKSDAFSVGAAYNQRENELGAKSLETTVFGATVALGPGSVSALYGLVEDDNPQGLSGIAAGLAPLIGAANAAAVQNAFIEGFRQDGHLAHIGYKLVTGPNTLYFAYSQFDDKRAPNADTRSYGVAYTYSFSKRTDVNAVAARMDNSGLGQLAPGGGGYLGGVTTTAATDSTSLALGLRHRF